MLKFICYPKCTTCQRAKQFLEGRGIAFEDRHIVEARPTAEELRIWIARSGLPVKKFFNTCGQQYKAMELKNKLPEMTEDEQLALLASNGMLVKRPLVVGDDYVLTGFKEKEWEEKIRRDISTNKIAK